MKIKFLVPVFLSALTVLAVEGDRPSGPAPRITCDEPNYNFGQVAEGSVVEHTFEIRNDGDISLEVTSTKTSCGCTVADISSKLIGPGETATIKAKLDLKGRRGSQKKQISVYSNDPVNPKYTLTVFGLSEEMVKATPSRVFFNSLVVGQQAEATVALDVNVGTMEVKSVETTLENMQARIETLEAGKKFKLHITVDPLAGENRQRGSVVLHTSHPKAPKVDIPVYIRTAAALSYLPERILVSARQAPASRTVMVRPGMVRSFNITGVEVPDESIKSEVEALKQGGGYSIQLSGIEADNNLRGSKIRILTDVEKMPVIELPIVVMP